MFSHCLSCVVGCGRRLVVLRGIWNGFEYLRLLRMVTHTDTEVHQVARFSFFCLLHRSTHCWLPVNNVNQVMDKYSEEFIPKEVSAHCSIAQTQHCHLCTYVYAYICLYVIFLLSVVQLMGFV